MARRSFSKVRREEAGRAAAYAEAKAEGLVATAAEGRIDAEFAGQMRQCLIALAGDFRAGLHSDFDPREGRC